VRTAAARCDGARAGARAVVGARREHAVGCVRCGHDAVSASSGRAAVVPGYELEHGLHGRERCGSAVLFDHRRSGRDFQLHVVGIPAGGSERAGERAEGGRERAEPVRRGPKQKGCGRSGAAPAAWFAPGSLPGSCGCAGHQGREGERPYHRHRPTRRCPTVPRNEQIDCMHGRCRSDRSRVVSGVFLAQLLAQPNEALSKRMSRRMRADCGHFASQLAGSQQA
jgi:hypothetical protein